MTIPTTVKAEYTRAIAAEKALSARIAKLEAAANAKTVALTPTMTSAQLLAFLADNTIDVIECSGRYALPYMLVEIDRTRPVVVRPAAGATAVFSGANAGGNPQFHFGLNAPAGRMAFQGIAFDGFHLAQQGIVQMLNAHDISFTDIAVRNSLNNDPVNVGAWRAWAAYLSASPTVVPTNIVLDRWTLDCSARQMSALQVYGGDHVSARGWSVAHAYYAIYAAGTRGPLSDFVLDGWAISDCGGQAWPGYSTANGAPITAMSVGLAQATGRFSNMHATSSAGLINTGLPTMTDGGGNVWA